MENNIKELIKESLVTWSIWAFGGLNYYLYKIAYWNNFLWRLFLINLCLSYFIGFLAGQFLPDNSYTNWLIAVAWFSSHWILQILEKNWAKYLFNKINNDNRNNK